MKTKIFCDIADFKTIKIFNKKSITFALGLGALDKNTIFLDFFFN